MTSAEIRHCLPVTTQSWVVLYDRLSQTKFVSANENHYGRSTVGPQMSFRRETIGMVSRPFSQATCIELVLWRYISAPCPVGWILSLYGSCYKISSNELKSSRYKAQSACKDLGSNLVILNSLAKIQELIKRTNSQTWIGLKRDLVDNSSWQWVDESRALFSYWWSGEPNNYNSKEDCVVMNPHVGKWNDQNCWISHSYVCEANGNTIFLSLYDKSVKSPSKTVNNLIPKATAMIILIA